MGKTFGYARGTMFIAALCFSSSVTAKSLKEFWVDPPERRAYTTAKSSLALEMCLGLEMSEWWGPPNVLRGEGVTLVTVATTQVALISAKVIERGDRREIVLGSAASWKGRAAKAVERCL